VADINGEAKPSMIVSEWMTDYERGPSMWAQMIRVRLKSGQDDAISRIAALLRTIEQVDSGLIRTSFMRDTKDPLSMTMLAVFESQEKARAREADPRRSDGLQQLQTLMRETLAGPPEFVDLDVLEEFST
jgi:quinol monooxygenase YgiN